jgi:predicted transcriptional regulator of viral defense system
MARTTLARATGQILAARRSPVVTRYELAVILFRLYERRQHGGQQLAISRAQPNKQTLASLIARLIEFGAIEECKDFKQGRAYKLQRLGDPTPEQIACAVNPFSYVSHLSAMQYWGLTDRLPRTLHLSTLSDRPWRNAAAAQMQKDCEGSISRYLETGLPRLTKPNITRLQGNSVRVVATKTIQGNYKNIEDQAIRVSTIGRTFLDMLKKPNECGGIRHVIDVYEENAGTRLKQITQTIQNSGSRIDKVRAGYLLQERLGLTNEIIESWKSLTQRGGSMKLDPTESYSPSYSEQWQLSINLPGSD